MTKKTPEDRRREIRSRVSDREQSPRSAYQNEQMLAPSGALIGFVIVGFAVSVLAPHTLYHSHGRTSAIDHKVSSTLGEGLAIYTTYDSIEVNDTRVMQLRVKPSPEPVGLLLFDAMKESDGEEHFRIDTVQVGALMKAELSGADFEIVPAGPSVQPLDQGSSTRWAWSVKPLSPGRKVLVLTLSVVRDAEGHELEKLLTVLRQQIKVISVGGDSKPPPEAIHADPTGETRQMSANVLLAAGFAAALILFLMIAYFVPPKSPFAYAILRVLSALCGGLAGGLITGEAMVNIASHSQGGVQYAVSGTAGFALFVIIFFFFPKAPAGENNTQPQASDGESGYNFRPPEHCTFEQAVNLIVASRRAVARLEGFGDAECRAILTSREIHARDAIHALVLLRDLAPRGSMRDYDVAYNDSVYYLRVRNGHLQA